LDVRLWFDVETGDSGSGRHEVFSANYTHNCNVMAEAAGIYEHVWPPDRLPGVKTAQDLIEPLRAGISLMDAEPERFKALNPANGWGSYATFLPWLRRYLEACIEYPKAFVDT